MRPLVTAALLALVLITPAAPGVMHAQTGSPSLLILGKFNAVTFPATTTGIMAVQAITLTNAGTADLAISSLALTGTAAGDFAIASNACSTVAPGAMCTITLTFTPTANGDRIARLSIGNNAQGAPHEISLVGRGVDPAVPQPAIGPIDPRFGFPITYTDHNNTTLELCLDHTPSPVDPLTTLCLSPTPDPTQPPSITDTNINFPEEAFWWTGEAAINDGNIDALLVLAQEAAFINELPAVNDQAAFGRLRIRLQGTGVQAGAWYRFTHPFGVDEHQADDRPQVFATSDIGCFNFPCDFTASFASRIKNFLTCVSPPPPAGYVGDPAVECTVDGSPLDTNFFRVERISGPGGAVLQVLGETNLFAVTGKRAGATAPPPPPANRPPLAGADTLSTAFDTAITMSVLGNDSDPDGDPLVITSVVTPPANGSAVNTGSAIVYTPNAGFSGVDSFVYEISDGRGGLATAPVTVSVNARINLPPLAAPESATTDEGVPVSIAVLANDSDPDGGTVSILGASSGSNGTTVVSVAGTVTYTPNAGFVGSDSFSYSISDGQGGSAVGVVTVTVNAITPPPPPPPDDLVLALGFNEASGTTVTDASLEANNGTISGATRSAGRPGFGGALTFDGVNDWVTVADNVSLDLSTAMTLEAWVRPTALGAAWRTILLKEGAGDMAYELYANNDVSRPSAYATLGGTIRGITGTAALALNTWTHVATTYDGANMRFYVNGVLVRTLARTGSILATTGPLHIGGNQVWRGEWFAGQIDELRIYSRALSQAEIQADMNTPIR